MTLNQIMRQSSSGMVAERARMDVVSANIANANSMRTPNQEAYKRQMVVLTGTGDGVRVEKIVQDPSPLRAVNDPGNPYADADGNVFYSNVDPVSEMVNLMSATRAYEANVAAFNSAKGMMKAAFSIGKA